MLTRRAAGLAAIGGIASASGWPASAALAGGRTVGEILDRIDRHQGAARREGVGKRLLAGDPGARVSRIAVTAMPDMGTLRKAVAAGCDMIVSLESPFYARPGGEGAGALSGDPTYTAKLAYIAEHMLAIVRLDADPSDAGSASMIDAIGEAMGWRSKRDPAEPGIFTLRRTTLDGLARSVKRRLGVNGGMRVIGRAELPLTRILVAPGRVDPVAAVKRLPSVDVLLAGDLREWELVEYIADSGETDAPKALIAVGRILSEQPGLLAAASSLRSATGLPVTTLSVADPYWRLPA